MCALRNGCVNPNFALDAIFSVRHDAAMTLSEYLTRNGISQSSFAEELGIAPSTVSRWISGEIAPSFTMAWRIERVTHGAVQPNDWREPAK